MTVIAPRGDRSLRTCRAAGTPGCDRIRWWSTVGGVFSFAVEFGWSFLCIAVRLVGEIFAAGPTPCRSATRRTSTGRWRCCCARSAGPGCSTTTTCAPRSTRPASDTRTSVVFRTLVALEWLTLRTATEVFATNESFKDNAVPARGRPGQGHGGPQRPGDAEIAARPATRTASSPRTPCTRSSTSACSARRTTWRARCWPPRSWRARGRATGGWCSPATARACRRCASWPPSAG